MSHEIRTPMNAVVGFTDLLLTGSLTPIQRQYLENVHSSADTLLVLINDILDFSKIEAGRLELELTTLNLRDHLEKAMDIVTFIAHEKGLELILDLDTELPHLVSADSVRLNQILTNLLTNAVKFTEEGEVELRARCVSADNPGTVLFTVRDTGIGMSEEQREKIFDSFTQADHSTTRKYGGTGLGLSISKSLVEQMGGHLHVDSTPNEGSSFFFSLAFTVEEVKPPTEHTPLLLKTALIIDDNRHNRTILDAMCHYWGIESHAVGNGLEALEYLKSSAVVDVAVLDYHMPFMDGLDVAAKIRDDLNLSHEELPIIFLYSSADDPRVLERCKELHIDYRLAKPIKMTQLQEVLERVQNRDHDKGHEKSVGPGSGPGNVQGSGQKYPVPASEADKTAEKITVLVAEDNSPNMLLAKGLLAKMFTEVTIIEAADGSEAVELFTQNFPDLILMDVQMPGKDGYSATADIRAYEAEHGGHTPIIALTAGALEGDREMCLQAGMDDYLAKPIQINVLRDKVQYWVYEKKEKPEAEAEGARGADGARAAGLEAGQFEGPSAVESKRVPSLKEAREYLYQQGHDDEIIGQMFDMLLERGPELRSAMQSALDAYDLESLKKAAHSGKGILNTLGMETAAEHAVDVEKRVDAGEPEAAASSAGLLMDDLSRMVELIKREIE
ncbi:MAG: response regulator [Spirochaetia bacterium]|nr:response regulator [Spirochaetia bacterium]